VRIAFLCGGLEAGRDGVGDYSVGLAGELVARGHSSVVVALNDEIAPGIARQSERNGAPIIRLARSSSWIERQEWLKRFLASEPYDWISLQFVPFGFHSRGLSWGLADRLSRIRGGARAHAMIHELWVHLGQPFSFRRHFILGRLQRVVVLRLLRRLNPEIIHTHAAPYAAALRTAGFRIRALPLFGSIPSPTPRDIALVDSILATTGVPPEGGFLVAGLFGAIHAEWNPDEALASLIQYAAAQGRKVALVVFGKPGPYGPRKLLRVRERWQREIVVVDLGFVSPAVAGGIIARLDFAFATTPWGVIGKSSAVAGYLDFGVPTLVTRNDGPEVNDMEFAPNPLLVRYAMGHSFDWGQFLLRRQQPVPRLAEVTDRFLYDLQSVAAR